MIPLFDYNKYKLFMESSFKFKGYDFLYFDEGVPYYTLFRRTRKLNTFWEVKYVAEMLWYLNRGIDRTLFTTLMLELSDRSSGHVIRTYNENRIINMCESVMELTEPPYVRRYRTVIFNPGKAITRDEKMAIVGKILGMRSSKTKLTVEKIYSSIERLMLFNKRITYIKISNDLGCARQTVSNNITNKLKDIIKYHNSHLLA